MRTFRPVEEKLVLVGRPVEVMWSGWRTAELLLLLLATSRAQSGDGEPEADLSCSSHISTAGSSVTCRVASIGSHSDDEDADTVVAMTACFMDPRHGNQTCLRSSGATISSALLSPLGCYLLTAHLRSGRNIMATVKLGKIVKPRPPRVVNVTFDLEAGQAVVLLQTPYLKDYLKVQNQQFQVLLRPRDARIRCSAPFGVPSPASSAFPCQQVENSTSEAVVLSLRRLEKGRGYQVQARSIPRKNFEGSWSPWSSAFSFTTPEGLAEETRTSYRLTVFLVSAATLTSCVVFFWKNKILDLMWPNIPQPKDTLVTTCRHEGGFLLLKPEEFSTLRVSAEDKTDDPRLGQSDPSIFTTAESDGLDSAPSSAHSATTEELDLSGASEQSVAPGDSDGGAVAPGDVAPTGATSGANKMDDEAYVTMSSFYLV